MERGRRRMMLFCQINKIRPPSISEADDDHDWPFSACAYYRPEAIRIHLPSCGRPCGEHDVRNWTYPGSTTDREPYGVVIHELGHHVDWITSDKKCDYDYFGDYGYGVCRQSREEPISGYHPNEAEWFAEMFRVFCTNPNLLRLLRPRTYTILVQKWKPATDKTWVEELGPECPDRVIRALERKIRSRR